MKRIPEKTQWFLGLMGVLALGVGVAGVSMARTGLAPRSPAERVRNLPLPALDRVVAKLAAEARSRTLATNSSDEIR